MTAKELLIPRFEIIASYPLLSFNIGRILTPVRNSNTRYNCVDAPSSEDVNCPEKYPHLFKKLNWWENRDKKDMPKKLKSLAFKDDDNFDIEKEEVLHIVDWDMNGMMGFLNIEKREVCDLTCFTPEYGYIPVD